MEQLIGISLGASSGFILVLAFLPLISFGIQRWWAFIMDAKPHKHNTVVHFFFTKIMNMETSSGCWDYRAIKERDLWNKADWEEYFFMLFIVWICSLVIVPLFVVVPLLFVIVGICIGLTFLSRFTVRTGKKVSSIGRELNEHIKNKEAHQ